jgi:bacteriorhodopsin
MANDALQVNYDQTPIAITRNGSNWLWAAFAVMVRPPIDPIFWPNI